MRQGDTAAAPPPDRGAADGVDLCRNDAWSAPRPAARISILVPFRDDDPRPLLASILEAAAGIEDRLELIVADDASSDAGIARGVCATLQGAPLPARVLRTARNLGRAAIRNRLAAEAQGDFLLFIDADMVVPGPPYLRAYLAACDPSPAVVYGGYAVADALSADPAPGGDGLAAYECRRVQCEPAAVRDACPWKYVYAGNLLVRRDVALACPFDEGFRGWGWEDVEFGMRAAERFPIRHVDNPVLRTRVAATAVVLGRLAQSVDNFARLVRLHPDKARRLRLYRTSRIAARVPFRRGATRLLLLVVEARHRAVPLRARLVALKLYQAFLYSSVGPPGGGGD